MPVSTVLRWIAAGLMAALVFGILMAGPAFPARAEGAGNTQLAQYYPRGGAYPPPAYGYGPPPCGAVNSPWRGAARGAAAGAVFGGIAGDAGKGAAIGAGVGLLRRGIQNSNARANGYCY